MATGLKFKVIIYSFHFISIKGTVHEITRDTPFKIRPTQSL